MLAKRFWSRPCLPLSLGWCKYRRLPSSINQIKIDIFRFIFISKFLKEDNIAKIVFSIQQSLKKKKTRAAESFIGITWNEIRTLGFYIFQLSVLKMLSHAVRQSTIEIDCHHINPDWQTTDCQEFKFSFLSNKRAFFMHLIKKILLKRPFL